jgi:hypothetical protein
LIVEIVPPEADEIAWQVKGLKLEGHECMPRVSTCGRRQQDANMLLFLETSVASRTPRSGHNSQSEAKELQDATMISCGEFEQRLVSEIAEL